MAKNPTPQKLAKVKLGPAGTDRSNIYIIGHGILRPGDEAWVPEKQVVPGGIFTDHIRAGLIEVVGKVTEPEQPAVETEKEPEPVVEPEPEPELDPTPLPEPEVEAPKKRTRKSAE